jgi:hypothetical protein
VGQETLQDSFLLSSQHGTPLPFEAGNLPVKRTATHIYFFGYEGPDPEVCFQQWFPSPFTDDSLESRRITQFPDERALYDVQKGTSVWDEVVAKKILAAEIPGEAKTLGMQTGDVSFRLTSSECAILDWGKLRWRANHSISRNGIGLEMRWWIEGII